MHGSGRGFILASQENQEKIVVLGTKTFFPAYTEAIQLCATQRLVTKPL